MWQHLVRETGRRWFLVVALLEVATTCADASIDPPRTPPVHCHGIIFDAGSSGSRIHVYTWISGGKSGDFELVEDDLRKSKPGLSSFASTPREAGASLRPLLAHAQEVVPKEHWTLTPVFLMATAGLRLLGAEASTAILESVADTLEESPFFFRREWAYIMSGSDEALFGWVTSNYLLGAFAGDASPNTVVDLGGGSVQLAYATSAPRTDVSDEHRATFSFAGNTHELYLASYLGFGLDQARSRVQQRILETQSRAEDASVVPHPCLPVDYEAARDVDSNSQQVLRGKGSYQDCAALYAGLFDVGCEIPPCRLNNVSSTTAAPFFGFSYLFDRTRAIGLLDGDVEMFGAQRMSIAGIKDAARRLCAMPPSEAQARFASCEDSAKWFNFCGDVTYIAVLLEHGFGIDPSTVLTMGNKIGDVEVVWTLGAMIVKAASLSMHESSRQSVEL
mmetsp:Transcript_71120/g.197551  ORF Transcript_71120/g.197551 Transcript_71120/m.197551 type:complete len:448 (+) Transcript_71120:53-1396(+)